MNDSRNCKIAPAPAAAAGCDPRGLLWMQFVLAQALARAVARSVEERGGGAEGAEGDAPPFCYADTHCGGGRLPVPEPYLGKIAALRPRLAAEPFFQALQAPGTAGHPGSWVLAGRIIEGVGGGRLAAEIDINDLDPGRIDEARRHREGAWVRLWTHDWFLFLRSRLAMVAPLDFVFIDPPADDARGPGYAIDAAILLETRKIPYALTYSPVEAQDPIDQIGRTGLELLLPDGPGVGILLGGGAEAALLGLLGDLRRLAEALGGQPVTRLPRNDDYSI